MSAFQFSIAVLALLATPGPTNTLMLLAGAERGFRAALALIPYELAGYLLTVAPLALIGAPLIEGYPQAHMLLAFAAGLWVAILAVKLWRPPAQSQGAKITGGAIFLTTLLNPKALIFGLVLLPHPQNVLPHLGLFALWVGGVALLWQMAGARLGQASGPSSRLPAIRRLASLWLAALSLGLVLRGVGIA